MDDRLPYSSGIEISLHNPWLNNNEAGIATFPPPIHQEKSILEQRRNGTTKTPWLTFTPSSTTILILQTKLFFMCPDLIHKDVNNCHLGHWLTANRDQLTTNEIYILLVNLCLTFDRLCWIQPHRRFTAVNTKFTAHHNVNMVAEGSTHEILDHEEPGLWSWKTLTVMPE